MKEAVQKCVAEAQIIDVVATRVFAAPVCTVLVAKFVELEVKKGSFNKAKTEEGIIELD